MYQEIARCSVTVTEEEVKAFNDERFALMEEDPTSYQIVKDYVDGLGITMEEYKEMSLEISRDSLLTAKYREQLMKEYAERDVQTLSEEEQKFTFEDYYNATLDALEESAQIKIVE